MFTATDEEKERVREKVLMGILRVFPDNLWRQRNLYASLGVMWLLFSLSTMQLPTSHTRLSRTLALNRARTIVVVLKAPLIESLEQFRRKCLEEN